MMDQKIFLFGILIIAAFALIIAGALIPSQILPYPIKIIIYILAIFLDVLAFATRYYTYIMMPLFKQRKKNITLDVQEPYWIAGSNDAIVRKIGEEFIATTFILIPLYRSATEMSVDEKLSFGAQIGRLISINTEPVRYSTQLHVMDKEAYLSSIRDSLNMSENEIIELTQKNASQHELDNAKGRVTMWRNMMERMSIEQSFELMLYASVSASGTKEYEATSIVQQRARDLMSGISSTLGITTSIITGNEMLKVIEPDHLIPYSNVRKQINANISGEQNG
ncbi:MAG: hypothetical protein M1385_01110 [Candidatus Marsarchaeota archaeon]|nr:hypothetical protein [Candidatus Marsarchaeota archaeon]